MISNDIINAAFEFSGSLFILNNCRALYKDKKVRGVSILTTFFFLTWEFWNIYYYPSMGQWSSFIAGCLICASNILWIGLMLYYTNKEKRLKNESFRTTKEAIYN